MYRQFFLLSILSRLVAGNLDFSKENFFIKDGYLSRDKYFHWDATICKDHSQQQLYAVALKILQQYGLRSVIDIGCGSGCKLMKYFSKYETVGYEIEPTLSYLHKTYSDRDWFLSDFSNPPKKERASADLLICSDVIEHIVNPDDLLNYIQHFDFTYLIISTPDRDKLLDVQKDMQSQTGPPINPAHMREWGFSEFLTYISQYFEVINHKHCLGQEYTQYIICRKRSSKVVQE